MRSVVVSGSLCGAFLLTLSGFSGDDLSVGHVLGAAAAVALYSIIFAAPVVFLYGMPVYALLNRIYAANYLTAALIGALPGTAWVLWTHGSWIDPVLWDGILIAIIFCRLQTTGRAEIRS